MKRFYNPSCGNYLIPVSAYSLNMDLKVKEFLKEHREYSLIYLSVKDGYEENMWCVTNFYK